MDIDLSKAFPLGTKGRIITWIEFSIYTFIGMKFGSILFKYSFPFWAELLWSLWYGFVIGCRPGGSSLLAWRFFKTSDEAIEKFKKREAKRQKNNPSFA